jgi:hypothetical protein
MSAPTVLYQNLLVDSQQGRGDGTIYAWGTTAVPDVAGKTFVLTTVNIMDDLGADADNKFNGYELKFDSSERTYLVLDWTASSDLAVTLEVPNAEDTGDWTMRRTLYTDDFAVDNPVQYAQDGLLFQKWIDKAANNTASIFAAAPNGVDDGGFELNSLTDYWEEDSDGDGAATVNSSSPILGTYDCKLDLGTTGTYSRIMQPGKIDLRKGFTYGAILKARRETAEVAGKFEVEPRYSNAASAGMATLLTWTLIDENDQIATYRWRPQLTTSNEWQEATFVVSDNVDAGDWSIFYFNRDSVNRYDVYVDEIYIWEIGPTPADGSIPNPDTLVIAGHNMAGGFAAGSDVFSYRCPHDLTGFTNGVERVSSLELDGVQVDGDSPVFESFTAETSAYPIIGITLTAVSGKTWEAAEIRIGKLWEWDAHVAGDWLPHDGDIETASSISLSGIRRVSDKWERRLFSGQVRGLSSAQYTEWSQFIDHAKLNLPFWFTTPAIANRGIVAELLFMRNIRRPELSAQYMVAMHASFRFEEVLGGSN